MTQNEKAASFRDQHNDSGLVLLPNVWDVMSAKLIESAGFPSLATASVALAAINGYPDGQRIPFELLVSQVSKITRAVSVPVSVDFERGYARDLHHLEENIKQLLDAGAIGINIEDSLEDESGLKPTAGQCRVIEAICRTASAYGVELFINARTDVYLHASAGPSLAETIERGKAYRDAGADCFYPITLSNLNDLETLVAEVAMPVNVFLTKPLAELKKLEEIGIKRVSLGPGVLKYAITKVRNMTAALRDYDTTPYFDEEVITGNFLKGLIS